MIAKQMLDSGAYSQHCHSRYTQYLNREGKDFHFADPTSRQMYLELKKKEKQWKIVE